jgi:uncharacterized protein
MNEKIIGMIHLKKLDDENVIKQALEDLKNYEESGIKTIIVENWEDKSPQAFISTEEKQKLMEIVKIIKENTNLEIGINVLPNDYKSAFEIAEECNLSFVQVDVLVDKVKTNYTYSHVEPFTIEVDIEDFLKHKTVPVFASIHPKHYKMLEDKSIEQSAKDAEKYAEVIVITGDFTGDSPDLEELKKVKEIVDKPVFVGSGLNEKNAKELLSIADGAIVGTAFKTADFKTVVINEIKQILEVIK